MRNWRRVIGEENHGGAVWQFWRVLRRVWREVLAGHSCKLDLCDRGICLEEYGRYTRISWILIWLFNSITSGNLFIFKCRRRIICKVNSIFPVVERSISFPTRQLQKELNSPQELLQRAFAVVIIRAEVQAKVKTQIRAQMLETRAPNNRQQRQFMMKEISTNRNWRRRFDFWMRAKFCADLDRAKVLEISNVIIFWKFKTAKVI